MNNLETLLATTVDKYRGNKRGAIMERIIKHKTSTLIGHPEYSLDGSGMSIAVSVPNEKIFNSAFALWIGGKNFSYE